MSRLERFFRSLKFIFKPGYRLMTESYNRFWDDRLLDLLTSHRFENCVGFTARLGNLTIWVANYPYGSMRPYIGGYIERYRPSRLTIEYAHYRLLKDTL